MTTLKERALKLIAGSGNEVVSAGALADQREMVTRLYNAYLEGPYLSTPQDLIREFKELDPWAVQDLIDQLYFEPISGYGAEDERERIRAVHESRRLNKYDVVTESGTRTWTNFGFGENIEIRPVDDDAAPVWNHFWSYPENRNILGQRHLHKLSDTVLDDGETFFVFSIDKQGGRAPIIRLIPTDEITEIIKDPNDANTPLWYKRELQTASTTTRTVYYPDWLAGVSYDKDGKPHEEAEPPDKMTDRFTGDEIILVPEGETRADKLKGEESQTFVCIMHVAHNCKGGLRGWPMGYSGFPWSRAHKQFRENRASVAAAVAMYVNKIKASGGSRAVDAIRSNLESSYVNYAQAGATTGAYDTNPASSAGSTWIENQAMNLSRMDQGTKAGDAKIDGESLLQMAGLAWGLYPHWLGSGDAYRLATATSMEAPTLRNFSRYQLFWSSVWKDVVMLVLMMDERYGDGDYETYNADVSTDRLVEVDLKELSNAVGSVYRDILNPLIASAAEAGINIESEVVRKTTGHILRLVLQALGVADANEIVEPLLLDQPEQEPGIAAPNTVPEEEPAPPEPEVVEMLANAVRENVASGATELETALEWIAGVAVDG